MNYACQRKHAAKYLTNDPRWKEKRKPHFAVGTALHKLAEAYALHGFVPRDPHPVIDLWINALKHVAAPRSHWAIEQKCEITLGGIPFEITPDWYGPSDVLPAAPKGIRAINDYKTSKDPKRYGLFSEAKKLADFQTVIYSHVLFGDQPGVFRHTYLRKTSAILILEAQELPEAEREEAEIKAQKQPLSHLAIPSDTVLQPRDISDAMERMVMPVADRVYSIRTRGKTIDPLTLPPNGAHCNEYGGCPHKQLCNLTPAEQLAGASGVTLMTEQFDFFKTLPINGPANGAAAPASQPFSAPTPFSALPAPLAPAAEVLPPGYSFSENPEFLRAPSGMYEPKAQVLAAFAAYQARVATPGFVELPLTPPAPRPVVGPMSLNGREESARAEAERGPDEMLGAAVRRVWALLK